MYRRRRDLGGRGGVGGGGVGTACAARQSLTDGGLDRSIGQTLTGLVREAVSTQNFARKYAFESSCRDLHNAPLCTALQSHFLSKFCHFVFAKFKILQNSANLMQQI